MGNQLTAEAPGVIYPVEHYLQDLPYYEYDSSLGSTRFFKVARARCREGLVVVRVFVIQDPSVPLPLREHQEKLEAMHQVLTELPNCLPFQKQVKLDRAAILIRQYVKFNLYDRLSTRPFLTLIEKKWIAFQLLCALNQCHKVKICHGDIKSENLLITSWNWMLLTDFASFKPTSIPYDNPAQYSYFFDTSRRRTCYIAPERFVGRPPADGEDSGSQKVYKELTPVMDIFSAGCVITELFCDGTPPFDLSQLLNYSCKNYSPWKLIDTIPDNNVKELVEHMIQRKPEYRLSAEEYLIKQRGKAFPEFFYTFFKSYCQQFSSLLPSDDKMMLLNRDMDELLHHIEVDDKREKNDKLVLIISLVGSVSRDLHFGNFRLMALNLLVKLSGFVTSDVILDRVLPYVLEYAQDPLPEVRAATIRSVIACISNLKSVPRNDGNVFQDYIIPTLASLLGDDVLQVRVTFAENIAQLADVACKYLDMAQAQEIREVIVQMNDQHKDKSSISETVVTVKKTQEELKPEIHQVESSYDMELQQLKDLIQQKIFQLISDPNHPVKMSLMANRMDKLCLFFGRQKANDILLSHIVTFLNVKDDWRLRACFFKTVVDISMYVGWQCSEVLLPLLQQGLNDPEEFVLTGALLALQQLTNHRLLNKAMMNLLVCEAAPLLAHPGPWIRQASVGFVTKIARAYDIPDLHCKLVPLITPFLTRPVLQLRKPEVVLDALDIPVPREVFDYLLRSSQLDNVFDVLATQVYIRSISSATRAGQRGNYPHQDEQLAQIFRKLTSMGLSEQFEKKLLAKKEFMLRLYKNRAGSVETTIETPGIQDAAIYGHSVTRRHAELQKQKEPGAETTPSSKKKLKKQESFQMNAEWKKMFGSDESDTSSVPVSSSPKSPSVVPTPPASNSPDRPLESSLKSLPSPGLSPNPTPESIPQGSLMSSDSLNKPVASTPAPSGTEKAPTKPEASNLMNNNLGSDLGPGLPMLTTQPQQTQEVTTRYAKCKWDLRDLVHHRRDQYQGAVQTADTITSSHWDSHRPPDMWRPKGILVAHLQEHRGAVNRLCVSEDHQLFASCSTDGTVRIWDGAKLEGKTAANRSKITINKQGGRIRHVCFLGKTNTLASASDNNTIKIYKLDGNTSSEEETIHVPKEEYGHIMDLVHLESAGQDMLAYATVSSHIVVCDLRSPSPAWTLRQDPRRGLITSMAVSPSQSWMATGTYSGTLVCWDLRFCMSINEIQHPSDRRVRRVSIHPSVPSWVVASYNWNSEVTMWDVETEQRQKTLWPSPSPPLSYSQQKKSREDEGICGIHVGSTDSKTFVVTGGTDMRLRFWDLSYPANSNCFSLGVDDPRTTSLTYRSQLIEGSEVIQELETQRNEPLDSKQEGTADLHPMHHQSSTGGFPVMGHTDIVSDIALCHSTQPLVVSASRNGHIKVWK